MSLQQLASSAAAGQLASALRPLILRSIDAKKQNGDILLEEMKSVVNGIIGTLPQELLEIVLDRVENYSGPAATICSAIGCVSSNTFYNRGFLPENLMSRVFNLAFSCTLVKVDVSRSAFRDSHLEALATNHTSKTILSLDISNTLVSEVTEAIWMRFERLSSLIARECPHLTLNTIRSISRFQTVINLDLSSSILDLGHLLPILLGPGALPSLKRLILDGTILRSTKIRGPLLSSELLTLLEQRSNRAQLEQLPLREINIERAATIELLQMCPNLISFPSEMITQLDSVRQLRKLRYSPLTTATELPTYKFIHAVSKHLTRLESLDISYGPGERLKNLPRLTTLQELFISGENILGTTHLKLPPQLTRFELADYSDAAKSLSGAQFNSLICSIADQCPRLHSLRLSMIPHCERDGFNEAIMQLSHLTYLSIGGRSKFVSKIYTVALSHPNLRQIDISDIAYGYLPFLENAELCSKRHDIRVSRAASLHPKKQPSLKQIRLGVLGGQNQQDDYDEAFALYRELQAVHLFAGSLKSLTILSLLREEQVIELNSLVLLEELHINVIKMKNTSIASLLASLRWLLRFELNLEEYSSPMDFLNHKLLQKFRFSASFRQEILKLDSKGLDCPSLTSLIIHPKSPSFFAGYIMKLSKMPLLSHFGVYVDRIAAKGILKVRNCPHLLVLDASASFSKLVIRNNPLLQRVLLEGSISSAFLLELKAPSLSRLILRAWPDSELAAMNNFCTKIKSSASLKDPSALQTSVGCDVENPIDGDDF